jgi:hypothetical protein
MKCQCIYEIKTLLLLIFVIASNETNIDNVESSIKTPSSKYKKEIIEATLERFFLTKLYK